MKKARTQHALRVIEATLPAIPFASWHREFDKQTSKPYWLYKVGDVTRELIYEETLLHLAESLLK